MEIRCLIEEERENQNAAFMLSAQYPWRERKREGKEKQKAASSRHALDFLLDTGPSFFEDRVNRERERESISRV